MSFRKYKGDINHCTEDSPDLRVVEGNKYMTRIDTSGSNIHGSGIDNIRYQGSSIP